MKQVQMPLDFMTNVYSLLCSLEGVEMDRDAKDLCGCLKVQVEDKLEALSRREAFSAYKVAESGSPDREEKRKEYLEKAAVHRFFQSSKEIPYEQMSKDLTTL